MTRYAVTGAAGFIGRAFIASVLSDGADVTTLLRRPWPGFAADVEIVQGDINDREALQQFVQGADVVVHLAAYVHRAARSDEERRECFRVNVEGTGALVEAMAESAPRAMLIFVSTANVYAPSDQPASEASPLAPRTPYGESKLAAERLVLEAVQQGRIRAAVLRPGMVFGPGAPGNLGRMIAMVHRRCFLQIGGGRARKTIVPVQSLVDAIRAVAVAVDRTNGQIYNVAGERSLTIAEIGDVIAGALGVRLLRVALPLGLTRFVARSVDAIVGLLPLPLPSFRQLVDTYGTDALLSDAKLRATLALPERQDVREALAATARATARVD